MVTFIISSYIIIISIIEVWEKPLLGMSVSYGVANSLL